MMDDERLIEHVRRYEFLYNSKHPKYMDVARKDNAWKEIADLIRQPAAACKQRWQCLRDSYRRALNKKKGKSGQAAKNLKQWKYENEMAFVVPFFTERKPQDSVDNQSDDEMFGMDNGDDSFAIASETSENHETTLDEKVALDINDYCSVSIGVPEGLENILENIEAAHNVSIKKSKAVKRKVTDQETASTILMAKLLDHQSRLEQRGPDEVDRFFLSISDTVKRFPPYLQALAKNKVFTLVSDMELQQLAPGSVAFTPSPQSECVRSATPGDC